MRIALNKQLQLNLVSSSMSTLNYSIPMVARWSEFPVPRVFFQKIYGFRVGISCSQSFFLKDLSFQSSSTGQPGQRIICRGPKTQVTLKIVPPVLNLPSPDQSRSQVPTPKLQRPEP